MAEGVELCRCWQNGTTSMVLTLNKPVRDHLSLAAQDVIAFRMIHVEGKPMILGEKVPLSRLAQFKLPARPDDSRSRGA